MKYESNTKRVRNKEIYQFRKDNPQFSLEEIGRKFPVNGKPLSRQRISIIIIREKANEPN